MSVCQPHASTRKVAMNHHRKPIPSKSSQDLKTPQRPGSSTVSRASKSSTSKKRASPALLTSTRPSKRKSFPNSNLAQSTLTQIDFVTQTTSRSDDDQLDYIEEYGPLKNPDDTIEPVEIDGDSDDDIENQSSLRTRANLLKSGINDDYPNRRRKSAGLNNSTSERGCRFKKIQPARAASSGRGKRKSTEKSSAKRDKTLTQMDFVRRYITIDDDDDDDDDDDVNMGYILSIAQNKSPDSDQHVPKVQKFENEENDHKPLPVSKCHRTIFEAEVDLSTGEPISQSGDGQTTGEEHSLHDGRRLGLLATPRKTRRLEIPSSQSPESPGLAIITSSQFRSATRSPHKRVLCDLNEIPAASINEETPRLESMTENPQEQEDAHHQTPTPSRHSEQTFTDHHPPPPKEKVSLQRPVTTYTDTETPSDDKQRRPGRKQKERMVVYETDADTDDGDSDNESGNDPRTNVQLQKSHEMDSQPAHGGPEDPSDDDSQDLPLPAPGVLPSVDLDSGPLSEAPMSDASMFYQRLQPATQFPHEPIPTLNTQRLSELFPIEESTQYPKPGFPNPSQQQIISSQIPMETQDATQIEVVPESSPVREQDNSLESSEVVFQRPRPLESVVQVESSQPVDRSQNAAARILSRSQLLTSSVMESIPLPNFWMETQDSVGEPYSLPDQ
ncbi:hypothetical protein N7462_010785 [Penicillium macrosclerotiorum]|uniref:uncharacterized protein n=1 Tax=Penicillium macrosclerotiorum TaxID=303699 RepID=UPI0025487BE5|nr:uncharacterized protein N7462_010785 [Penicillium macrosclerotiorum]KAJ5669715.1 hypothetical protein N7462_010785 [Penicillium macrosclerotiorum]